MAATHIRTSLTPRLLDWSSSVFSARCNIYILRLCYDVSVRLSVRLSATEVHCGYRVQWIPDTFACLDRWMSLLLTDNASPGSSHGMMPGFLVEEGGMEKLVIVIVSNYFTYWESGPEIGDGVVYIWTMFTFYYSSWWKVFTARGYAKRGICRRRVSVCLCVCVCLSHSGIVSKRLNVGSRKQRRMIAPWL